MIIAVIGFTIYFSVIADGVYLTDKDKMVEFYARIVEEYQCSYTTQLVYTSDNRVTAGFGKKLLYKWKWVYNMYLSEVNTRENI